MVEEAIKAGVLDRERELLLLFSRIAHEWPPESLLQSIVKCVSDRYYGLESLALASIVERPEHSPKLVALSDIPGLATTNDQKIALTRVWLRSWHRTGFWLGRMPPTWVQNEVRTHS